MMKMNTTLNLVMWLKLFKFTDFIHVFANFFVIQE